MKFKMMASWLKFLPFTTTTFLKESCKNCTQLQSEMRQTHSLFKEGFLPFNAQPQTKLKLAFTKSI